MDDTISRNKAIKATLALCPQNTKPGSLDEYGAINIGDIRYG